MRNKACCFNPRDAIISSIGVSNSYIFVIGGLCWRCRCPTCKGIRNYHEQSTVHYLDVSKPREQWAWKVAPDMSVGRSTPQFVDAGDSKIYVFGGVRHPNSAPLDEVFHTCQLEEDDRSGMCWDPLPALPRDILRSCQLESFITRPVVGDSKRQKILVHFKGLNSLSACCPSQNSWTCIVSNFDAPSWLYSVLVDDHGVLYSLRPSMAHEEIDWGDLNTFDLHAYNLVDNTPLP